MKTKTRQAVNDHATAFKKEFETILKVGVGVVLTGVALGSIPRNYSDSGVVSDMYVHPETPESFSPYATVKISGGDKILDRSYVASKEEFASLSEGQEVTVNGKRSPIWGNYTANYSQVNN